ncbi:nodulin MtN21 /EamA-like transporter family protein, partial [Prunus dulcis]
PIGLEIISLEQPISLVSPNLDGCGNRLARRANPWDLKAWTWSEDADIEDNCSGLLEIPSDMSEW